jgi:hypothetical protein
MTAPKMTNAEALKKARAAKGPKTSGRDNEGWLQAERAFVLHYLGAANRIATDAALLAGYGKGQRGTARRTGSDLMQRPHIVAEIERVTAERNERLGITAEDVLRKLLVIETEAVLLGRNTQALKLRREVVKDIGDHVAVGAFRKQVGLSNPNGGPIETADAAWLATATDEELEAIAVARAIIDRRSGQRATHPLGDDDSSGDREAPQEA